MVGVTRSSAVEHAFSSGDVE